MNFLIYLKLFEKCFFKYSNTFDSTYVSLTHGLYKLMILRLHKYKMKAYRF